MNAVLTCDLCRLVFVSSVALVLVALILFAIAGNVLVIAAVLLDVNLRRTSNCFVVSLACADTLVATAVMTFALVNDLLGRWVFGEVVCRLWLSADVMCSTASILSLCAVSFDRWVHVRRPLHYERSMTSRRAILAVLSVWALSALISFVPIHLDWHRQRSRYEDVDGFSTNLTDSNDVTTNTRPEVTSADCTMALNSTYAIVSSLVSFYVPCAVMVLIYAKLYRYARFHADNIRQITAIAGVCAMTTNRVLNGRGVTDNRPPQRGSEHKAAVTLGIIVGVFLVCWAPFFTVNVIGAVHPSCVDPIVFTVFSWLGYHVIGAVRPSCVDPIVFTVFSWLGYLNSTMNPVIYCVFNRDFRVAFKRIILSVPPPRTFSFRSVANRRGLTHSASAGTTVIVAGGLDAPMTPCSPSEIVSPLSSGITLVPSKTEQSVVFHVMAHVA